MSVVVALSAWTAPSLAAEPADAKGKPEEPANKPKQDPDAGIARPDADDLRTGHVLISLSGGAWFPSDPLFPASPELGEPAAGGTAHLHLGFGLSRYLVLELGGGFAMAPSAVASCEGCQATSVDVGASLLFHPTQGFAFDPWVGYGMGYRHNILSLDTDSPADTSGFDFMKLALGGTFSPTPVFGFGPFLETDVGVRSFDDATFYAAFQLGMRVTFDPLRGGATAAPAGTSASLRW